MTESAEKKKRVSKPFLWVVLIVLLLSAIAIVGVPKLIREAETDPPPAALPPEMHPFNGFDLSASFLTAMEVNRGGVPKDGIAALTDPRIVSADDAEFLTAHDRVIGVSIGAEARAYPLKILTYHEVANDTVGGEPIAVTYCPLCDSSAVFDRRAGERVREFGVSGLLFNSNVLMYERGVETESLLSQMMRQGVSGPMVNETVMTLPLEVTTWSDWRSRHPHTKVVSTETGHQRDYGADPYADYFQKATTLRFPVAMTSDALPLKAPVLGVWTEKASKAYSLSAFGESVKRVDDEIDGQKVTLQYDAAAKSLRVARADDGVQWVYSFWFAWYAFHPQTDVHVFGE